MLSDAFKRRKFGKLTGNAGEYFVMGELLRRGFDAQLADRNTKDYELLVGYTADSALQKIHIRTTEREPWHLKVDDFTYGSLEIITIYVLLGSVELKNPVRFFIAKNRDLAKHIHQPSELYAHSFMSVRAVLPYEDRWDCLDTASPAIDPTLGAAPGPAAPANFT